MAQIPDAFHEEVIVLGAQTDDLQLADLDPSLTPVPSGWH